ncbi:uncharacterized protein DS421_12g358010 [Arachis hypogaea]|nr:uncharacterized protein DS421_12g358010 [Arachis hypogaea]
MATIPSAIRIASINNTAMSTMAAIASFPATIKLDDDNFKVWKRQALTCVKANRLQNHLTRNTIPQMFNTEADREQGKVSQEFENWEQYDECLVAWMLSSMNSNFVNKPNRLESPPQPYCQSLPLPQPQLECPPPQPSSQSLPLPLPQLGSPLQSQHQSKSQTDISKMTEQFFNDTWGYQPPLEMIAVVGGHQQHQVWTWEENKAFESVIANCFQDAIHNHWKTVAARLPGKTPAQLQERFLKLMTDVNAIKNGNPENMNIMLPVSATPLEHSLLSIPVVNATPPLPPPHWTHHQHHRMQAMAPAADMAVPMHITLLSSSMSGARREQNQHANSNIIQHKPLYAASSNNNKRQQTVHWTLQEHKHVVSPRLRRIRKTMEKRARGENLGRKSMLDITDYST